MALRNFFFKFLIPSGVVGGVAKTLWGFVKSEPGSLEGGLNYKKLYKVADKLDVLLSCEVTPADTATKDPGVSE